MKKRVTLTEVLSSIENCRQREWHNLLELIFLWIDFCEFCKRWTNLQKTPRIRFSAKNKCYILFQERLLLTHSLRKSVRIRRFSGLFFPAFGLNTERYGVFSPNAGK